MTPKPYTLCGRSYDADEVDRYIADLAERLKERL